MRTLIFCFMILLAGCKSTKNSTSTADEKPKKSRKLLTAVTITGMELSTFPKYARDGEKWDAYAPGSTDPDVFVVLKWNENLLLQSEVKDDCAYGTPVVFTQNIPLEVKPFDQPLLLEIFDEDGVSSNDNMAYFNLNIKDYEGKSAIELVQGELTLKLNVQWTYK